MTEAQKSPPSSSECVPDKKEWLRNTVIQRRERTDRLTPVREAYEKFLRQGEVHARLGKETTARVAHEFVTNLPANVLYSDADLVIVNKPAGIYAEHSQGVPFVFEDVVRHSLGDDLHKVHRLDRNTTGLMVFARNIDAHIAMLEYFTDKEKSQLEKIYLAFLEGRFTDGESVSVDVGIAELRAGKMRTVKKDEPDYHDPSVQWSQTKFAPLIEYETNEENPRPVTLAAVQIMTGRRHQIRVTASESLGMPIVGDKLYESTHDAPRFLLHAYELTFPHPRTSEAVSVQAPPPQDFEDMAKSLKRVKVYGDDSNK